MQRVRIGLTGLACVFLLVLLAASLFGLTNGEPSSPVRPDPGNVTADAPKEPLAELGVAPGNAPEVAANATQPPKPATGQ